ncbi:MAG: type I glyceraldehyde-3-phosphate dehydrogenase [Nitrososphaerota archaeon]
MIKVGINGFGRIGRQILRAKLKYPEFNNFDIIAINDLASSEMLAYLLKYDSIFGKLPYEIKAEQNYIIINNKKIRIFQEPQPEKIPWNEEKVNYVIEATGRFTNANEARKHLLKGAKRVIITAPAVNEDITIVMGVNEHLYEPSTHFVISTSSCISNSAIVVLNLLMKFYNIEKCFLTSVHAYTNTQRLLDMVHPTDFRRSRAAGLNMVPVGVDFNTIEKVIPVLRNKIDGVCIRVPVPSVSLNDLCILIKENTNSAKVNILFKENQNKYLRYTEEPIVSSDIIGDTHSAIIDGLSTKVIGDNLIKILAWYDNEWSYALRILDLIKWIAEKEI